ncbi:actin-like protein arp8 [Scheffersomyces spartinae]|uniref:Actin-like protein arp8 n=1 Tax=Scheffersomyces spartinae TaxID=45513 RepID=A0A9P7V9X2_9ASCO|nr:actin-like protein arp8 [Scheffersomyces spartinae]KAG7194029.1 actin-like protein arp8 [Scheffersomyces spartinae]
MEPSSPAALTSEVGDGPSSPAVAPDSSPVKAKRVAEDEGGAGEDDEEADGEAEEAETKEAAVKPTKTRAAPKKRAKTSATAKAKGDPKKPSAEVLQRRKEGRIKAAMTIAENLKKTGIGRFENENNFGLTSVKTVPLINQKNYFTDYLKRDEQVSFVRNWRLEKNQQQLLKKKKEQEEVLRKQQHQQQLAQQLNQTTTQSFDNFDLAHIKDETREMLTTPKPEAEDDDDEEDDNDNEDSGEGTYKQGSDTVVIHPGSTNIRIGRATEAYPTTIPSVIAVRTLEEEIIHPHEPYPVREVDANGDIQFDENFNKMKAEVTKDFKARMRFYKRRVLPNSRETAANFNRKQYPERIPDHNDPYRKEWLLEQEIPTTTKYLVGEEALKLPPQAKGWKLRYPIIKGRFNEVDDYYRSPQEVLGDLSNIVLAGVNKVLLEEVEVSEEQPNESNGSTFSNGTKESSEPLKNGATTSASATGDPEGLTASDLKSMNCILVIPDLYDKAYVEAWCEVLFKYVGFGRIAVIQESVAATFGAGTSSACVIDMGSQTTSITCVDEGLVINDLRILLDYGGDDITTAFVKLLLESAFPYNDIDLRLKGDDWELAQQLKEQFVTCQDADIAVQLYSFYKRKCGQMTEKYDFKVFDEVMLAPLGLFYPALFEKHLEKTNRKNLLFPISRDQYLMKPNNPFSQAQESLSKGEVTCNMTEEELLLRLVDLKQTKMAINPATNKPKPTKTSTLDRVYLESIPLEKAIVELITNAGLATDFEKTRKFYDNLLVVGGGFAKISGFDLVLSDRINIWRPRFLSTSLVDEVVDKCILEKKRFEKERQALVAQIKEKRNGSNGSTSSTTTNEAISRTGTPGENGTGTGTGSGGGDDIILTSEELQAIDKQVKIAFDIEELELISEKGLTLGVNVLPPPREFDPEMLTWKGASVFGRIKVITELWISHNDWDLLQSRCLFYKSLFTY